MPFKDWDRPVTENLDLDDRGMQELVLGLPKIANRENTFRLFDSHSRASLQERLQKALQLMDVIGFNAEAGDIDKIVGEKPNPVWRVVITYRYEPYNFPPIRRRGPSL